MKQADYWKNRFTQLEEAQNQKSLDYYSTLEDEFSRAARNVDKELAAWYTRFAKNENISYEEAKQVLTKGELSAFKMSVEDYIKKGKTLPYSDQWAKELERASAKFHVTRLEAIQLQMQQQIEVMYGNELDAFDQFISNQYKAGYYKTMFEFQKGFGVGFDVMKLDDNKIAKLIAKSWAPDGLNFSSRIWRDKNKLMAEMPSILTQATIRGDGYDKTAKLLAERFNVSKSQAKNLVITESAFFSSEAQTDCFNNLGVVDYEIIATLDGKTSEICRMMDGKVFDMKDRKSGITAPPFHGRCRSTSAPYFNDEFELNTKRAARDPETGKTYHVPADMKYPDWEKSFVEGGSKGGLEVLSGGINIESSMQYAQAVQNEPKITEDVKRIAEIEGLSIEGLEYRLKSRESYSRKIAVENESYEVNDIIRYTYIAGLNELSDKTIKALDTFRNEGYNVIKVKNTWLDNKNPYNGINTIIEAKNKQRFELQFHTQESFDLKNGKLHEIYENQRIIKNKTSKEFIDLQDEMFDLSDGLEIPVSIEKVK